MKRHLLKIHALILFLVVFDCLGEAGGAFCFHFPLDEAEAVISDAGPAKLSGHYYPSASSDNDMPATTDPARYRLPGHRGRSLKFFKELGSAAQIDGFKLPAESRSLYVSFYVKAPMVRYSAVLNCKWDSGKNGFALFAGGNQWFFNYGDGARTHQAVFQGSSFSEKSWLPVKLEFTDGTVSLWENGRKLGTVTTPGKVIAGNSSPLVLGNYQEGSRRVYAFEGGLDEVCIADSAKTAAAYAGELKKISLPELEAFCEPVEGNERHFGKVRTLNTFAAHPIPLTFQFRLAPAADQGGAEREWRTPQLVLQVPAQVRITESFVWSWRPERQIPLKSRPVKVDSLDYTEYTFASAEAGRMRIREYFGEERYTVALCPSGDFRSGKVHWKLGEADSESFVLNVLPEPAWDCLPTGQFSVMAYCPPREIFYRSMKTFDGIASLYAKCGLQGCGRNTADRPYFMERENRLRKKFGFRFFEVNMWEGPLFKRTLQSIPAAVNAKGQTVERWHCPYAMARSTELFQKYVAELKQLFPREGSRAVILDFEPWGRPAAMCYCPDCLKRFRQQFKLGEEKLTPDRIAAEYQKEWGIFWTGHTDDVIGFLARAARKVLPEAEVWDYTYLFDYDTAGFERRFWEIPKNPVKLEKVLDCSMLSLYHVNGAELIDKVRESRRHLEKEICGVMTLSRTNAVQGRYTPPRESLSPRQIYQKIVLLGALGMKTAGLYPGNFIDGAYFPEIGQAVRDVRIRENFYFQGEDISERYQVAGPGRCIVRRHGGRILMTLFNFSDQEAVFSIRLRNQNDILKKVNLAPWNVDFFVL